MTIKNSLFTTLLILVIISCKSGDDYEYTPIEFPTDDDPISTPTITDEELLDLTQAETFKYFWNFAEVNSGAARERYHPNDPNNSKNTVTTGGTGFGIMALIVV